MKTSWDSLEPWKKNEPLLQWFKNKYQNGTCPMCPLGSNTPVASCITCRCFIACEKHLNEGRCEICHEEHIREQQRQADERRTSSDDCSRCNSNESSSDDEEPLRFKCVVCKGQPRCNTFHY
jgi:hypothetical protein